MLIITTESRSGNPRCEKMENFLQSSRTVMSETTPHVYDPLHDYHSFQHYIIRIADQGSVIDLTEYYGGEAAGREDDRVFILTNGRVITHSSGQPRLYSTFEIAMKAFDDACTMYPIVVMHGLDDQNFLITPAEKVEQILSVTHCTDNGRGLNEYPQVAGRINKNLIRQT